MALSLAAIIYVIAGPSGRQLTDAQIVEALGCGRATADFRATDVYCTYPEIYRQHLGTGKVIGQSLPPGTRTFYLTFVDAQTKKVISRTGVKIASNNGVLCSPGSCNTNPKSWTGSTNGQGTIELDSDYVQIVMTAEVSGYQPITLASRAGQQVYVVALSKQRDK